MKIIEKKPPIFSKKMTFLCKMGALEATSVYSKNVKKMQVFKAFLKISCKEFYNFGKKNRFFDKKMTFLQTIKMIFLQNDFVTL